MRSLRTNRSAFTLLELLVSMAAGGAIMASILYSSITLQRSFYWSTDYAAESIEQLRAIDYISRDLRGALTVTIPTGGLTLSLELPDHYATYDAQGNPTGVPLDPAIVNGTPQYGDPAQPLVVTYYVSSSNLIRQQIVQATGQTTQLIVARNVNDLQMNFVGLSTVVKFSIRFAPRYHSGGANLSDGTTIWGTVSARTIRFR